MGQQSSSLPPRRPGLDMGTERDSMLQLAAEAFQARNFDLAADIYECQLGEVADPGRRQELLLKRADALAFGGKLSEAFGVYRRAAEIETLRPPHLEKLVEFLTERVRRRGGDDSGQISQGKGGDAGEAGSGRTGSGCYAFSCRMCQGFLFEPVTLSCGHTFCKKCLERGKGPVSCRQCRSSCRLTDGHGHRVNVVLSSLLTKWFPGLTRTARLRREGNGLYSEKKMEAALEKYNEAILIAPRDHILFSNRSQILNSLRRYKDALRDADKACTLTPNWSKGHVRRAQALVALGRTEEALREYLLCLSIEADCRLARSEAHKLLSELLAPDEVPDRPLDSRSRLKNIIHTPTYTPSHTHTHTHTAEPPHSHTNSDTQAPTSTAVSPHTHSPTHTHTFKPPHTPTHTHTTEPTHTHTHTHTAEPTHTSPHTEIPAHTPPHTEIPAHTDLHTHTTEPTHTHTHTHTAEPTHTPSHSEIPAHTDSRTPTHTVKPTHTPTHTVKPTHTPPHTEIPAHTDSRTPTHTVKPTHTPPHTEILAHTDSHTLPAGCTSKTFCLSNRPPESKLPTSSALNYLQSPSERSEGAEVRGQGETEDGKVERALLLKRKRMSGEEEGGERREGWKRSKSESSDVICSWSPVVGDLIDPTDLECSLCMRLFYEPVTTPCGHSFCLQCLERCLDHKPKCPLCKEELSEYLAQRQYCKTVLMESLISRFLPSERSDRQKVNLEELAELSNLNKSVPIFVCTMAFPTVPCPLHIFEPCYRLMIRRCMETGTKRFGMCLADNLNGFADYGCLLEIRNVEFFSDGRSVVDTIGRRRFKVLQHQQRDGYNTANIEYIEDVKVVGMAEQELRCLHDTVYEQAHHWVESLTTQQKQRIVTAFGLMPAKESEPQASPNGPSWCWWVLAVLPLEGRAQLPFLALTSLKERLSGIRRVLLFMARSRHR